MKIKKRLTKIQPIHFYKTQSGKIPFKDWYGKLDAKIRGHIFQRLERIEYFGEFGDSKLLRGKEFILELRFHVQGGIRIYATLFQGILVLFIAGNKQSQKINIETARKFYHELRSNYYTIGD